MYSVQSVFSLANKTPLFPFLSYAHAHIQSPRSFLTSAALLNPSDHLVKASYCNTFKVSYFPFTTRTMYTRIASDPVVLTHCGGSEGLYNVVSMK